MADQFVIFIGLSLNDLGEAAFLATLRDDTFANAPTTLFAEFGSLLERIIGVGDMLEVAPGDFRKVSFLSVASDGFDASQQFYNTAGHITFRAAYEGGGSGIFVATIRPAVIPLPPVAALLLTGLAGLALVRRRRAKAFKVVSAKAAP